MIRSRILVFISNVTFLTVISVSAFNQYRRSRREIRLLSDPVVRVERR